ncbi:MAG: PqqD family peptide modification chaperone [Planctomycetaceae bacterium]|nr:PqqD family peptide modification chaperone [Planctomycetaceae bacterium]
MLHQSSQAALQPTTQRPVPLRARRDLVVEQILYLDTPFPVVKDPVGLKYYRLQPEQYAVLNLLDGQRSLQDIRDDLQVEFPTAHVTPADVQMLVTDLHEKGLLLSDRSGQGEAMVEKKRETYWKEFRSKVMNPLYIRLPGWDPDETLEWMLPWTGWIFSNPALILSSLFVFASWIFLAIHFDDVRQKLPEFHQFFAWPNLVYLWMTMAGAKVIHEFGHGISCKKFGGECHSMGVMLLVFSPTLYCDVTDSWMMKNKWHRILIGAGGMYVEVILAAVAIFVWYATKPGMINHLCLNVFFVSTVTTVIFNANPLLRYDGYYMLSDYLEIPNLRPKATKQLQQWFAWLCLGIEVPNDPFMPTEGKLWFVLFAIASSLYRWVVLFGITVFLYTVLKPYRLQSIGIMLAVSSIGAIIGGSAWSLYKLLSTPREDPLSKIKLTLTTIVVALAIAGILRIPVPWYEEVACYVEPVGIQHVYTLVPGFLEEIHKLPEETIDAGQPLVTLHNPDLLDRRDELLVRRKEQETEPLAYRELNDPDGQLLSEQRLATIDEQLAELDRQLGQSVVLAPISGRIVAPQRIPEPLQEQLDEQLPQWHGTPLEDRNVGAFLDQRTHIASIAPESTYHAVMLVHQADRADLDLNSPVRVKLDLYPDVVFDGKVTSFSDRYIEFAPPALSNKYGGPLPTVSDSQGREKLTSLMFQGTIEFAAPPPDLTTGMRGRARFVVEQRTLFDWIWRWFRQTFHFRL